jgi:hypothetical protein
MNNKFSLHLDEANPHLEQTKEEQWFYNLLF